MSYSNGWHTFRKSEIVTLIVTAELELWSLEMAVGVWFLRNPVFLAVCLLLTIGGREGVAGDRRPEMQSYFRCIVLSLIPIINGAAFGALYSWKGVLMAGLIELILSLLRWLIIGKEVKECILRRYRPVDQNNAIRVSSDALLKSLCYCVLFFSYAALSYLINCDIFATFLIGVGGLFFVFTCRFWTRGALLTKERLVVLGPKRGEYLLRDLAICKKRRAVIFRDSRGKTVFRMSPMFQNGDSAEFALRKRKMIL